MKRFVFLFLFFPFVSYAHHLEVGVDPFPWTASGWHQYQRTMAYNIAFNHAVGECQDSGLVLDTDQLSTVYGYSTLEPGYHTATLTYYCEEPPPSYWKQTLSYTVSGSFNCNPGVALSSAEDAGAAACAARNGPWFMGDYTIMGVQQVGSGSCGHGSWGPNDTYKYTILPECWKLQ